MLTSNGQGLVFILSTPRAGSTLLSAILGSHSQILCPPEPWLLLPLVGLRKDRLLIGSTYDHSLARLGIRQLLDEHLLDDGLRALVTETYGALLRRARKSVFVDKTPRYYQILEDLEVLFPEAKKIWLKRQPLDVITSFKDTWGISVDELTGKSVSPYTFDTTVSFSLLADFFAVNAPNKLVMRYEDLVASPDHTVASLCEFLQVAFEPTMLEYGGNSSLLQAHRSATMGDKKFLEHSEAHQGSLGKWKASLSASEVQQILLTLGSDIFHRLGYADLLAEALAYTGLTAHEMTPGGNLPELLDAYHGFLESESGRDGSTPGMQYTRIAQEREQLRLTLAERQTLIDRLSQQLGTLQADLEGKEREIATVHAAAEERLAVIEQLNAALAAAGQVRGNKGVQPQEAGAGLTDAIERLEARIAAMAEGIHQSWRAAESAFEARVRILELENAAARAEIEALRQSLAGERQSASTPTESQVQQLQRERELAEAVAQARLEVIEGQKRRLQVYESWDWRYKLRVTWSPKLGSLHQHPPRPMYIPSHYKHPASISDLPSISIITPSFNHGRFIERTITSVLNQQYPGLQYIVQDAASTDETLDVLNRYSSVLAHVESAPDTGFGNGINRGFGHATGEIMGWLNSDDLLLPGALSYVGRYFAEHPDVDVVYGHRVVIDEHDAEIGRWVLPPHDSEVLTWADYVPQETLFWRRRIWDKAGGAIDESFRFAIDWDLLLRFREAGATFARLPRFLGAFRVHPHQKTSAEMSSIGIQEMNRLRERCHGRPVLPAEIDRGTRAYLRQHILHHKLYRLGILRY